MHTFNANIYVCNTNNQGKRGYQFEGGERHERGLNLGVLEGLKGRIGQGKLYINIKLFFRKKVIVLYVF